ncbi:MAG: metallophosphoesterase [Sphingobacteriaceae bacterium]|nr:MAG: metallophosphoesterase [Sphingobacteriaceae bacterium]
MKRRNFLYSTLAAGAATALPEIASASPKKEKPVLTVAHITDVHIHGNDGVPERAAQYLNKVLQNKDIDFIMNGGDSIFDASYDTVTREMVTTQWGIWDNFIKQTPLEIYSCIGNHDPWWKAPSKTDEMYGIPYVVRRLKIPHRYYSFSKKGWHFIVLDGNNEGTKLDAEQMEWLKTELGKLKTGTPVILMSHYPMLSSTVIWSGGGHGDYKELKALFYQHKDKVRMWLSGHQHLRDSVTYNGVTYLCNGAVSGFWWGKGDKESAGPYYYQETPPGYALLHLYADGRVENEYISLI